MYDLCMEINSLASSHAAMLIIVVAKELSLPSLSRS